MGGVVGNSCVAFVIAIAERKIPVNCFGCNKSGIERATGYGKLIKNR